MNKKIIVVCGIICIMLHSQVFALRGLKKPTAQPVPVPAPAPAPAPKPAPAPAPKPAPKPAPVPKPAPANIGELQAELVKAQAELDMTKQLLLDAQRMVAAGGGGMPPTGTIEELNNMVIDGMRNVANAAANVNKADAAQLYDDAARTLIDAFA